MNYLIKYSLTNKQGTIIKQGTMKVKNKESEYVARVRFMEFLKRKNPDYGELLIHKCEIDNGLSKEVNDLFGNIFRI